MLGVESSDVTVTGNEVSVEFFQPPVNSSQEMMILWFRALDLVAEKMRDKERIVLHPLLADGTLITVGASKADVLAYRAGELSAPGFLSTLQLIEETSRAAQRDEIGAETAVGVPRDEEAIPTVVTPEEVREGKEPLSLGVWLGVVLVLSVGAGLTVWQVAKRSLQPGVAYVSVDGVKCAQCGAELAMDGAFCTRCSASRRQLPPLFAQAELRHARLWARYRAGKLDEAAYRAELQDLVVQDQAGGYWTPGGDPGQWLWYDGRQWVQRDPPLASPEDPDQRTDD